MLFGDNGSFFAEPSFAAGLLKWKSVYVKNYLQIK